ncbi:Leucine-rich repeat transmembrane protein kinase [Hibiscus syriacus]|uniref:non-specific serine/threonine protein kinase n=1 Tax=Hibiscus syriacus TaxID=106335 RepID=A0A6A3BYZ5_HIBSY|nr:Leucine-rich repeat transmembrane protein kinase [Hibiscus syriacus]
MGSLSRLDLSVVLHQKKGKRMMKPLLSSSTCFLFFFFLVVSFWCSQSIIAQKAATDPSEVRALNTIFQQWDTHTWNISGEPCSGFALSQSDSVLEDPSNNPAIRCDCSFRNNTLCHITSLTVYALDKRGVIPEELLDLPYLTFLSISHNDLSGPIPKELGSLKELYYFFVRGCADCVYRLPLEFGRNINSCGLGGEIPSTFANLVQLRNVWASDNAFTSKIPEFVGNNWTKLTSLQFIKISRRFQGNSFEGPIPSSFANLTSLNSLRISDIYNGSSSLDFVRNLKNLTDLVLRNALLTGVLPSYIIELQSLQKLDLSFNNFIGSIPSNIFTMGSLRHLFLGNNSLSGAIPGQKSEALQTIDLSYNLLSGNLPSWVNSGLQLNLVGNNISLNSLNIWRLPGLECLQRSFPCNQDAPRYAKFSIKCGGSQIISNGIEFEADDRPLGAATYVVNGARNWAVSNVGLFADRQNEQYEENTLAQVRGTNTPELYHSSRLSPGSLRYYGLGLENGLYTVNLFFAETGFPDRSSQSWKSLARRVFDVYILGTRKLRDFDISKEAGGVERAITKNFTVNVTENRLEIHLFWAGKGTYCTPEQGYYGPSISAISVVPYFISTAMGSKEKNWTKLIVVLTVSVVVLVSILIFSIFHLKRKKQDDEEVLLDLCPRLITFRYSELKAATEDFISSNKLGEGGFGDVFKV